jgi:hypothetical protein
MAHDCVCARAFRLRRTSGADLVGCRAGAAGSQLGPGVRVWTGSPGRGVTSRWDRPPLGSLCENPAWHASPRFHRAVSADFTRGPSVAVHRTQGHAPGGRHGRRVRRVQSVLGSRSEAASVLPAVMGHQPRFVAGFVRVRSHLPGLRVRPRTVSRGLRFDRMVFRRRRKYVALFRMVFRRRPRLSPVGQRRNLVLAGSIGRRRLHPLSRLLPRGVVLTAALAALTVGRPQVGHPRVWTTGPNSLRSTNGSPSKVTCFATISTSSPRSTNSSASKATCSPRSPCCSPRSPNSSPSMANNSPRSPRCSPRSTNSSASKATRSPRSPCCSPRSPNSSASKANGSPRSACCSPQSTNSSTSNATSSPRWCPCSTRSLPIEASNEPSSPR